MNGLITLQRRAGAAWTMGALLLSLCAAAHAQRLSTPLSDGWAFLPEDIPAAADPAFDDGAWSRVTLPHTWNGVDGERGGAYRRGASWYRRGLDLDAADARERRRYLEFDAATLAADVWVNGRHAGRHEGGYARFRLDISAFLRPGPNLIAVRVDNGELPGVAPLGGDFTVYGGLIRPVRLIETAPLHIELMDHGGPGVAVETQALDAREGRLRVRVQLRNDGDAAAAGSVLVTLRDARGRVVDRARQDLRLEGGGARLSDAALRVPAPHRWQGVEDPYLYRLSVELRRGAAVIDTVQLPVGLRHIAVDPDRGLLLNGKPYALRGVNYFHPGRPGRGVAVGDAEIDEDLRLLTDLGVTGLRLVHYQHPQRVYERADELGLLLWTEIPFNAAMRETPAFRDQLDGQLRELVRQTRQHPSVAVWGIGNEIYRSDEPVRALLAHLHEVAHREDPSRPTSYAHCCAADDHPMALQTDLAAYNRYWGWYDGGLDDIGPWLDQLHRRLPGKPIALSEFGAGGSVLQQEDPPRRPQPGGRWHPEQYQALFHEAYARQLATRPFVWANFVWLGFDHASAGRNEGDVPGLNDKGLITYDRRFLKDAYHLWRAWWQRAPVLHLANRRASPRPAGTVLVKAYGNGTRATLQVNGLDAGTVPVIDRVATWSVALKPGRITLQARDDRGSSDRIEWDVTAPSCAASDASCAGLQPAAAMMSPSMGATKR